MKSLACLAVVITKHINLPRQRWN